MEQELTYKWIQERLREFHSGKVSEQDLVRLKKIAEEDPFVADALEGFDAHPNEHHAAHLQVLEQKIKQPKRERRRWLIPNLTVTAIAASVLVIIATYAVVTRIQKESEETIFVFVAPDTLLAADTIGQVLAMEEDVREMKEDIPETAQPAIKGTSPEKPSIAFNTKDEAVVPPSRTEESDQSAVETAAESIASGIAQPANESVSPSDNHENVVLDGVPITSKTEMSRSKKDEGYYANQMNPDLMHSRVTGRILDAAIGTPLPAAKLAVSYTNQLFYADVQGHFELFIPEPEVVLQASYDGYVDSMLIINAGEENLAIALSAGGLISPMAIPGGKSPGPVSTTINPAIESHLHFSRYIKTSSLLQLSTEAASARRKVTVEFKVKDNGKPYDIRILESSRDKTYDEEAMRLLKSGPDWVCPGGEYPCVRQYTFLFR